jgi:hypothetical protein
MWPLVSAGRVSDGARGRQSADLRVQSEIHGRGREYSREFLLMKGFGTLLHHHEQPLEPSQHIEDSAVDI